MTEKEDWWQQPKRGEYIRWEQGLRLLQAILACLIIIAGTSIYAAYTVWDFRSEIQQLESDLKRMFR